MARTSGEKLKQKYIEAGIDPEDIYASQKYYLKTDKGREAHRESEKRRRVRSRDKIHAYETSEARRQAKAEWARENRRKKKEESEQ